MRALLEQGGRALGLRLDGNTCERLEAFGAFLVEKNQVMNLTAITEETEVAQKHFLDSLALAGLVPLPGRRMIDVGTGAGFPGIPLKLAVPELDLTLLDGQRKRVLFLEEACQRLGIGDVRCVHGRAEEYVGEPGQREAYTYAVSRAVAQLSILAELCLPYVEVGGAFLAMKAADCGQETEAALPAIAALGGTLEACHRYALPGTEITRCLLVIRKVGSTPEGYPRRFAKIQKRPLG